ncbi:hypothetical protein CLH39_19480 [Alcaligenes faecalis]|nr:hypothetical protein CLH39_19480 [Alcaligenes faecalis]
MGVHDLSVSRPTRDQGGKPICMGEITNILQTVYCNILFWNSCPSPEKPEVAELTRQWYFAQTRGGARTEKGAFCRPEQDGQQDG